MADKYKHLLLENKICVITGVASVKSIGYATAELFAVHGAKLVLLDLLMNDAIEQKIRESITAAIGFSPELLAIPCDLTQKDACDNAIAMAVAQFGNIDCLVNCAGIVKPGGILSIDEAEFDSIMDINLKGTFNICKSVLQVFKEKKKGVIVNLASLAAQRGGGLVGGAHYAASKGGVMSLTRSIAREFAPLGIRANAICPAMIETNMLDALTETQLKEVIATIPLRRVGKTLELAGTCLFLASELSGFITGATIDVNGGIHIH
jgi:NAD(P)-dependent dehydrogenase (short-subunit alcohol dehydrogenase family)